MLVKEVMQIHVVTIHPEATLREAAQRMLEHGVNGLPVVDQEQQVIGIIGLKDILRAPMPSLARASVSRQTQERDVANRLGSTPVSHVMATKVWTVNEDDPLMLAVTIMVNEGLHPVPVLRHHRLVGIISRADAVHGLLEPELARQSP